jgi:hypothetical protein
MGPRRGCPARGETSWKRGMRRRAKRVVPFRSTTRHRAGTPTSPGAALAHARGHARHAYSENRLRIGTWLHSGLPRVLWPCRVDVSYSRVATGGSPKRPHRRGFARWWPALRARPAGGELCAAIVTRARWKRSAFRCDLVAVHRLEMIREAGGDVRLLSGTVSKTYEYRDTSMGSCVIMGRKRTHQRAARFRPPSPEQDVGITAPSRDVRRSAD